MSGGAKIFDDLDFDAGSGSFTDSLQAARQLSNPVHRVGALVRISRRDDLTEAEKGIAAVEALNAATRLESGDTNRLFIFTMLGRDFLDRGDRLHAARAAQLLAESYSAFEREDPSAGAMNELLRAARQQGFIEK